MKNRRIFLIFTVLTIFLSMVISSYQIGESRKFQVNESVNVSEEFEVNLAVARDSSTKIMKAFRENDEKNRTNSEEFRYTLSGISADGFPDYYAGKYINVDGNLVVLLTDEYSDGFIFSSTKSKEARRELAKISGQNDIIYGSVKYSMKELLNAMEKIYTYVISDNAIEDKVKITTFDMYENKNIIEVGLYPFNEETIKWFKTNVTDEDFIVFYEREHSGVEATASIRPGGRIKAETGNSYFSVGFRAYKGSTEGFVTCAHPFHYLVGDLDVLNASDDILGTSYESERRLHDLLDAAFVRKTAGNTYINTLYDSLYNSISVASGYVDPSIGDLLYMCGQNTNGQDGTLLTGYVINTNATAIYYGERIIELYAVNYYSATGDSGGIVFERNGSIAHAAGIQVARNNIDGYSYVCKATNIVSEFGLTIQ